MEILTGNAENVATKYRWQEELKRAFRDIDSLLAYLDLNKDALPPIEQTNPNFPIFVPRPFASRIEKGDPSDPLLRQVIAMGNDHPRENWTMDPVQDKSFEQTPGLLHKYHGRVLLILTGACAIHCRYCFRQHFDYSTAQKGLDLSLAYIAENPTISEIILSGGDPLMKTDSFLLELLEQLQEIPHVKRIRFHTRVPVVLPSRVTSELLDLLGNARVRISMVLHINHGNEIDRNVEESVDRLRRTGALMLNQAVLLEGINADLPSQQSLAEKLIDIGVLPYYLHLLDPVKGAEKYFVAENTGIKILKQLRQRLPGYCVPKLVREEAGESSKTAIQ